MEPIQTHDLPEPLRTMLRVDGGSALDSIMNAPMIPCDVVQWSLFGISFAGWNFLVSVPAALVGFALLRRSGSARG